MKVSKINFLVITLLLPFVVCGQQNSSSQPTVKCIVLDAGHGGKDPGAVCGNVYEKDITLSIALKLGKLLEDNMPEVKVVYTRNDDTFVDLAKRGDIANKASADVFMSIHVDSNKNSSAKGASTYVMGIDPKNEQRNLAEVMKENDVVVFEEDYAAKYEGYVPGSVESYIIFSLMQYAGQEKSMQLAECIQHQYATSTPMADRGAKQQPLLVLWKSTMPRVLTEVGFLSNASDRACLTTQSGQRKIATALFNALSKYKGQLEGRSQTLFLTADEPNESAEADTTVEVSPAKTTTTVAQSGKRYWVQICALGNKVADNDRSFKSYRGRVTQWVSPKGAVKCLVGGVDSMEECKKLRTKVRDEFPQAFIVVTEGEAIVENIYR